MIVKDKTYKRKVFVNYFSALINGNNNVDIGDILDKNFKELYAEMGTDKLPYDYEIDLKTYNNPVTYELVAEMEIHKMSDDDLHTKLHDEWEKIEKKKKEDSADNFMQITVGLYNFSQQDKLLELLKDGWTILSSNATDGRVIYVLTKKGKVLA